MPRKIHKIVSKQEPKKEIILNALGYEEAVEEALDKLGWTLQGEWDEPYNSMFQDEHMMSLNSQRSEKNFI